MNRLDHPVGILKRFRKEFRAHQLAEAPLDDGFRRSIELDERACAPLDLD